MVRAMTLKIGDTNTMPRLHRQTLIATFFVCRQGERSVHWLATVDANEMWSELKMFYVPSRLALVKAIAAYYIKLSSIDHIVDREEIAAIRLRTPDWLRALGNRFRSKWLISNIEVAFIAQHLQVLVEILEDAACPSREILRSLRRELFECQSIIHCRMIGCWALEVVDRAEHFYQSEHGTPTTLADVGIENGVWCENRSGG